MSKEPCDLTVEPVEYRAWVFHGAILRKERLRNEIAQVIEKHDAIKAATRKRAVALYSGKAAICTLCTMTCDAPLGFVALWGHGCEIDASGGEVAGKLLGIK
jgi:hypothetical protein